MDLAMDSQSTTSEHSIASSVAADSPTNASLVNQIKSSLSPTLNNNNTNSNTASSHQPTNLAINHNPHNHNSSGSHTHSSCGGGGGGVLQHNSHHQYHHPHSNASSQHRRSPTSSPPPLSSHRHHHSNSPLIVNGPHMMPMPHPLSPPQVSTPNSMVVAMGGGPRMSSAMGHLPPHGLGLLSSLQMMHHANPLELMAAAHHHVPPRSYNSPPPISTSDPTANECKLVDYRGQKVAAFIIAGDTMLCLPQAFELFLKHLVGGLHTVYTKLKRLDIVPLVCNVEQVRILRGLGAIQPGVNRCKLLSCKDFDILYRDCTTARCLSVKPPESSRPGRPPKRGSVGLSMQMPTSHMSHHPQLKKHRMENGDYAYENGHLSDMSRIEKSPLLGNGYNPPPHLNHMQFMQLNHHPGAMMSPNMPPHGMSRGGDNGSGASAAMLKGQAGMPPGMDAIARSGIWENCRAAYEDIVKHLERLREERVDDRDHNVDIKPRDMRSRNGSPNGHSPILNLSKSVGHDQESTGDQSDRSDGHSPVPSIMREEEDHDLSDDNVSEVDEREDKEEEEDLSDTERQDHPSISRSTPPAQTPSISHSGRPETPPNHHQALNYSTLAATAVAVAASNNAAAAAAVAAVAAAAKSNSSGPGSSASPIGHMQSTDHHHQAHHAGSSPNNLSSTETLLRNIQSLLTVAADNARQQERQISYEKAELKMDVLREREVKDSIERQFSDERKLRVLYQKRYKKERRARVRIQNLLDVEQKRRNQMEDALKAAGAPPETLRPIAENQSNERRERPSSTDRRTESPYSQSNRDRPPSSASQHNQQQQHQQQQHQQQLQIHQQQPQQQPTLTPDGKPWNYPGLDLMASGAFWQNYSETLAQEIEMERKSRQQSGDRDVKTPLQDRQNYYKNSVLFSSAT